MMAAPDPREQPAGGQHRGEVQANERGVDRGGVTAWLCAFAEAQQQQAAERPRRPARFDGAYRVRQPDRGDIEVGEIPPDSAVRSGDYNAARMNVLVARRLVAVAEAYGVGDRPHRGFRPGQEMPVRLIRACRVSGDIFAFGRGGIRRRVAWV